MSSAVLRPGLRNALLLLVLTFWSAAQAHCDLEALGWLPVDPTVASGCCAADDDCAQDNCDLVEQAEFSAPSHAALAVPPQLFCTLCLHCAWAAGRAAEAREQFSVPWARRLPAWSERPEVRRVAGSVVWRI